jgi:hypothetical protein
MVRLQSPGRISGPRQSNLSQIALLLLWLSVSLPLFPSGGVNPKTETLVKAHLAERTVSGKETSGAVSERVPADGGRAI